jgi:tripartite-type tricarboxylate transporter receptor subunit TctC
MKEKSKAIEAREGWSLRVGKFILHPSSLILSVAIALSSPIAVAQSYPVKSIRIVVPFTPGTGMDILARSVGAKLSERWGQGVVIDNRAGASGNIGSEFVAKSPADGYTLMVTANTFVITPALSAALPFDAVRDFTPVTEMAIGTMALAVHPSLPVNSVAALVKLAKARPGEINYASPGAGTPQHMAAELFKLITGIQMVHVPYKGSAGAVTDLVGGQVPVMFLPLHTALPHAQAGRLRVLAQSGAKRSAAGPDYPTFDQAGVHGVDVAFWYGMLAPAALPREIVTKLNAEIAAILRLPEVRDSLSRQGLEPVTGTPEQFAQLIRTDLAKWARVVTDARIAAD